MAESSDGVHHDRGSAIDAEAKEDDEEEKEDMAKALHWH
jgi:hypothetical protein